jgi:hypothetical protein
MDQNFEDFAVREVDVFQDIEDPAAVTGAEAAGFATRRGWRS